MINSVYWRLTDLLFPIATVWIPLESLHGCVQLPAERNGTENESRPPARTPGMMEGRGRNLQSFMRDSSSWRVTLPSMSTSIMACRWQQQNQ